MNLYLQHHWIRAMIRPTIIEEENIMSHFNVAVFSHTPDEVDALLAPFIEQVEPYSPYAVFEEDEDYEVDAATGKQPPDFPVLVSG